MAAGAVTLELGVTIAIAVVGLATTLLKIFQQRAENDAQRAKLETTEKVVAAIGDAINVVTPILGVDKSRTLKNHARENASSAGVSKDLDSLIAKYGLNDKPTAELADPNQSP